MPKHPSHGNQVMGDWSRTDYAALRRGVSGETDILVKLPIIRGELIR